MLCKFCNEEIIEGAQFCHHCGGVTEDQDSEKLLGVKLTKDDIISYLFKGSIEKEFDIGSGIKIRVKTLTQNEQVDINVSSDAAVKHIVRDGGVISPETMASVRNKHHLSKVLVEVNGATPPDDIGQQLAAIIVFKSSFMEGLVLKMIQENQIEDF